MSVMEIEEPLRRTAVREPSEIPQEEDGFLRAYPMGGGRPAVAREADDGFVRVNRGAAPRTGDDLMAHMQPRERQGGVRGFLRDALSHDSESPGAARQLARFGMGMNGEATAGVPGLIAGQVAMNGLDVAEAAGLGGPNGFTGGLTGTMRRDIGRTAGIAITAVARKAILDTGERPEDVAGDTRSQLAQVMAHRKALIEKRRAGGDVGRNEIGRSLVHKWAASTRHGANVEYMGHRPEFGYTMQESAGINNRRAIRRAADDGAVRFIDRKPGTELVQPGQQPGEAPIVQTDAERRRGARDQNLAAITRGGDELGRVLQNDEGGLDDLYKGNTGKALAKGGVNTARNIGVGIGAALSGDPTGGYLAYPILDAGLKVAGAGVSAASQAIGHATGIEAKAQLQDDKDLYNRHYFGDKKGEGKPLDGFDTAREEEILRSGLRERGHANDIGSERAGLPQYDTGNAATSFLKRRLGKGVWTRWWRDAVTEPRAVGQIAAPAARGVGSTLKSVGKFAAKYTGLAFLGRKIRSALSPEYRDKQRAKKAERDALIAPPTGTRKFRDALLDEADSGAPQAPSLADVLAPEIPAQRAGNAGEDQVRVANDEVGSVEEEEKEPDLLSQIQAGDPGPPARPSESGASRAGTLPAPELRASRVGGLLEEGEQGAPERASKSDEEMVRLAAERQGRAVIADEDSMLRKKLAKETKAKDTFVRNYVVGETLGFGKFDKARHNISAWISHFKNRDIRTGQDVHSKARKKDPAGYERKRQEELERIRKRLRGEELGPTGRSMLDVVPDMADRMDREEAVRSGHDPGVSRQAGDLGPDFDFDDILQRRGSEASEDSASAPVSTGKRKFRNALSGAADVSEESVPAEPHRSAPAEGSSQSRDDAGVRRVGAKPRDSYHLRVEAWQAQADAAGKGLIMDPEDPWLQTNPFPVASPTFPAFDANEDYDLSVEAAGSSAKALKSQGRKPVASPSRDDGGVRSVAAKPRDSYHQRVEAWQAQADAAGKGLIMDPEDPWLQTNPFPVASPTFPAFDANEDYDLSVEAAGSSAKALKSQGRKPDALGNAPSTVEGPVMEQSIGGQGPPQPVKEPGFFDAPAPLTPITELNSREEHPAQRPFGYSPEAEAEWRRDLRRRR